MTPIHTRIATGVAAIVFGSAAINLTSALAQESPTATPTTTDTISTTCGAGTLASCGTKPVETCDFAFGFSYDKEKGFSFNIGWTNCKVTGSVPIYKDLAPSSSLSMSCNLLNPFLGMPAGSGCSD